MKRAPAFIALLLIAAAAAAPLQYPDFVKCDPCEPSQVAVRFIQRWEGYVPILYRDAAGYWTIGFGHLCHDAACREQWRGKALKPHQADSLFWVDLDDHAADVNRLIDVPLWQWQYDALVSLDYNIGGEKFRISTLRRHVNQGHHAEVVEPKCNANDPAQFVCWRKAGGRVLRGLILRRQAEARLYNLTG